MCNLFVSVKVSNNFDKISSVTISSFDIFKLLISKLLMCSTQSCEQIKNLSSTSGYSPDAL